MGVYDRDYYRKDEPTGLLAGRSMVVNLIIINVLVFVADMLSDHRLVGVLALPSDLLKHPWDVWKLVTYGFAHDPQDISHIAFNMFGLWMFGRELESLYGRAEFTRLYLATMVFAGLVWVLAAGTAFGQPGVVIGASGAVTGIIVLNVLHFPRRTVLLFGVLPMPAWAFAALFLAGDVFGATRRATPVAHMVHLGGAAFVYLYWQFRWNLGRLVPASLINRLRNRPNLRVHSPTEEDPRDLSARVDEILDKIHRKGEASLSSEERRTLEEASRRYQRRQR